MAVSVAVMQAAATVNTAPYTQDFTIAGFGTPKAALFFVTWGTVNGTAGAHAVFCTGMTDGTTHLCTAVGSRSTQADTVSWSRAAQDEVIYLPWYDGVNINGEANFDSWITDGVRINWANAPDAAYLITVVLFGGTDLSADVSLITPSATEDATVDVATIGFEPDQVIVLFPGSTGDFNDTKAVNLSMSIGFCDNGGSLVQRCVAIGEADNVAAGEPAAVLCTDRVAKRIISDAEQAGYELGTFDASGFSVTTRNAAESNAFAALSLNYNSAVSHWVGSVDTPTSTGNDAITSPSFTPQLVMLGLSFLAAEDTLAVDGNGGAFGIGVFDDSGADYSNAIAIEDASATTDTESIADDEAINLHQDDGSAGLVAPYVSMDANGWTLNYTTTDGTARKLISLAIGAAAVGRTTRNTRSYPLGVGLGHGLRMTG